jgi:hypothetical protein
MLREQRKYICEISGSHGDVYEDESLDIASCSLAEVYRLFRDASIIRVTMEAIHTYETSV